MNEILTLEQFRARFEKQYVGALEEESAVDHMKRLYSDYLCLNCHSLFETAIYKYKHKHEGNLDKQYQLANALKLLQ